PTGCRSSSAAATSSTAPAGGFFSIDGDVKRGAAPPIPKLRIRSTIQQESGDVIMVVVEGEHQRGHALGCRHIHIRAGANQCLDTVVTAVTCRVQQRGESANRTILRAGFRGNLAGPVGVERTRLDVGAVRKK